MKKKMCLMILIIFIMIYKNCYASNLNDNTDTIDTNVILEEQQASFGIKDFLKETENYLPDFISEADISNIFNSAIKGNIDNSTFLKKIWSKLGAQVTDALKIIINILIIVLIHSILKSIIDGLQNNEVAKIVYYVQYILIITIIMANFTDILKFINNTIDNLIGFSQSLIPLLITLMTYTGSITTTTVIEPILLFLVEFIANIIKIFIIPVVSIITVLIIASKISDRIQISKIGNFMKSSIIWSLGIILTLFVGVLSLEGSLTSSIDGITAKTAKAAVSSLIPIVRENFRRWSRCGFGVRCGS